MNWGLPKQGKEGLGILRMGTLWFGGGLRELAFSGLTVAQLHGVLSAWKVLPRGTKTWEEAVAAGNSGDPYPMGPFAYLVQSLRRYRCTQLTSCVFPSEGPHVVSSSPYPSSA